MELPRKTVPTVLTLQPLLGGIEPELFLLFAGPIGVAIYTAQSNLWNLLVVFLLGPPIFVILKRRTEKDPFFFRVFRQGLSFPKFLPARSGYWAPPDRVLTKTF
jgi:type IV secretory pathway TrbD component